jgi:hypothetical protein
MESCLFKTPHILFPYLQFSLYFYELILNSILIQYQLHTKVKVADHHAYFIFLIEKSFKDIWVALILLISNAMDKLQLGNSGFIFNFYHQTHVHKDNLINFCNRFSLKNTYSTSLYRINNTKCFY